MGNIIFPCDDDNEIKVKEIHTIILFNLIISFIY